MRCVTTSIGLLVISAATPVIHGQITARVSVSSEGVEANGASNFPAISANGRYICFRSSADNLVSGDTNNVADIFVFDRTTWQVTRVNVSSDGAQANASAGSSTISEDGRFVAFSSTATNLVPDDTNGFNDVFLHDRHTGETRRVSVSSMGEQANNHSHTPAISADGRYIAFESAATNLVPGITNSVWDIFVHDQIAGETFRVSVSSSGSQSNGDSRTASISADGRYVAFSSAATTLVPGTPQFTTQIYVHDRSTGKTTRASVSSEGQPGNDLSLSPAISGDGRWVAFSSFADNLDPNDQSANEDVFVHDRMTGQTMLVALSSTGEQANSSSFRAAISDDGRYVSFVSHASNLAPGTTNGVRDVFVRDLQKSETYRASVSSDGTEGDANSGFFSGPALSGDGQHVVFESLATTLVQGDTNGVSDIFVHGPQWPQGNPGDLNGDGVVDVSDLLILLGSWGPCPSCPADLNGDSVVDVSDLLILLGAWGDGPDQSK